MVRVAGRLGPGVMAALSVAVASFSFRLVAAPWDVWILVDSAIRDVVTRAPLPMLAHAVFAATALLVGPEGGFDQTELDALSKLSFVSRVGLGPRVLRAETAAVAALAIFQAIAGDWRCTRTR